MKQFHSKWLLWQSYWISATRRLVIITETADKQLIQKDTLGTDHVNSSLTSFRLVNM